MKQLRQNFTNFSEYYELFIIEENNKEIKIDSEEKYSKSQDILFIRPIDKSILEQSLFQRNFEKLSESNQDILSDKFNCSICTNIVKKENPYLCYKCQKIFHEKCLKDWDKKCKLKNKSLNCPICRNELPIEKWNKKLNFEENRKVNANIMNRINDYKLNKNMNNNMNMIKEKKLKEFQENEIKQKELIKKYEEYINKTITLFKNLLNKINSINDSLNLKKSNQLNNLINTYPLSLKNLNINEISNVINEELDKFIIHLKNNGNNNININNNEEIIKKNKKAMEKINNIFGYLTALNNNKIYIQNYLNDVEQLITVKDIENKQNNEINIKTNIIINNNNNNNNVNKDNNHVKEKPKESNINTTVNKINLIYFVKSEGFSLI